MAKSLASDAAAAGPKEANARAAFAMWLLVQPLIAFGISTLASYTTLLIARPPPPPRCAGTEVHTLCFLSDF